MSAFKELSRDDQMALRELLEDLAKGEVTSAFDTGNFSTPQKVDALANRLWPELGKPRIEALLEKLSLDPDDDALMTELETRFYDWVVDRSYALGHQSEDSY